MKYTVLHLSHKMPMWTGIADYRIEVGVLTPRQLGVFWTRRSALWGEPPQPTLGEFAGLRRTDAWKNLAL
ncbi:MAG: hypothetical protein JWN45_1641 [Acidobacteriaceae bacterium]|jgi:hypothetical protein|nr:hypothetical protein [Acidobacteriaceae bacterium]